PYVGNDMARIFRRSILWLVPVIVIPLAALVVIQYRFLRSLETKTIYAERSWLRDSAERIAGDVDQYYRTAALRALPIQRNCPGPDSVIGAHFAQTPVDGVRTFFVVHFDGPHAYYSFFSSNGTVKKLPGDEEQAVKLSTVTWHVAHKMKRAIPHPPLSVDERDLENRIIMRPVVDGAEHVLGVAGLILDERQAHCAILGIGSRSITKHYPEDASSMRLSVDDYQVR